MRYNKIGMLCPSKKLSPLPHPLRFESKKKGEFVSRESGTEKKLRNWLMVSDVPFGSYQPE